MDKQDIVDRLDFYQQAPPELRSTISAAARHVKLAPGDFLFKEGDASREFAAVGVGSIRVFRIGATGREITLYHVRSQQSSLVSMLAVLLGRSVIATGQAEVATEAVLFPATALREWVITSDPMRRYIFETDIIATDPPTSESWDGSAISSREYYQAGHRLLTPGGLMLQVVRYGATLDEFKNQLRTFHDVFPHTLVAMGPGGYGVLLLGSDAPIDFSPSAIVDVLGRSGVLANLSSAFDSPEQTLDGWARRIPSLAWIRDDEVSRFVGAGPMVTDDHPIAEYVLLHRLFGSSSPRVTPALLLSLTGQ